MSIRRICHFLRYDKHKLLVFKCFLYSVYYKSKIQLLPMNKIECNLGQKGAESQYDVTIEQLRTAYTIAYYVNKVASKAPWRKKCFARALTLQKLLKEENITSTLYMGVGKKDGKMVAHAWLRCGSYYLTGGNGAGFAIVASYHT